MAGLMNSCAAISELEVPSPAGPPRPFASTPRAASKGTAGGRPALARSRAGQAGHRSMSPVSAEPSTQSPRGPARRDLDALGTASLVRPRLGRRPMLPGAVGRSGVEADGNRAHVSRSQRCAGSCSVRARPERTPGRLGLSSYCGSVRVIALLIFRTNRGDSRCAGSCRAHATAAPDPVRGQLGQTIRSAFPRLPGPGGRRKRAPT